MTDSSPLDSSMTESPTRDSSASGRPIERLLAVFSTLTLCVVALRYGLMPVGDYDYWWQVRTGQEIWQQHSLLLQEPFSYLAYGRPWLYKDGGAELLFYFLHHYTGVTGAVLLKAAAFLLWLGILSYTAVRYRGAPWWVVVPILVFGIEGSAFRVVERPQTLAFAMTALLLWVIERHRTAGGSLLWCFPLLAVTANLHRAVWLMPPLLIAYGVSRVLDAKISGVAWRRALAAERATLGQLLLGCLGALVTPFTVHSLFTSVSMVGSQDYSSRIPEWQPLTANLLWDASPWAIGSVALAVLALLARGRKQAPWDLALLLLALLIGLRSVRFIPYLFLLGALPTCSGLTQLAHRISNDAVQQRVRLVGATLATLLAAGAGLLALESRLPLPHVGLQRHHQPEAALSFVRAHQLNGRVFNEFQHGGYLIFHLWPQTQVFIDGRNDWIYTPEELELTNRALGDPTALEEARRQYGFDWLFLANRPDDRQRSHIDRSPRWALVFTSEAALIYVDTSGPRAALKDLAYRVLKPHDLAASIVAGLQSGGELAVQTIREAERMVSEDPESYPANVALAMVYQMIGHPKAGEQLATVQWLATRPR